MCIDGIDVRRVSQQSLRRQVGVVPQDSFLFAGTIAENIRFGWPEASDAQVEAAAQMANAHEFISSLPDGYQTMVLENAANLSVGQRQLICIARAVLVNPRILVLDEATANIDTVSEVADPAGPRTPAGGAHRGDHRSSAEHDPERGRDLRG